MAWTSEQELEIDGVRFLAASVPLAVDPGRFLIVKPPAEVERYLQLLEAERPRRMVELGVKEGGSAALCAVAARPELLLAIDLAAEPPALLAELARSERQRSRLQLAFGIDQGDRAALTAAVERYVGGGDLDLVIDDASHILGPSRTSFEVLFPRLRPGGLFLLEDWNAELMAAEHLAAALPDVADFDDRLDNVTRVLHILNSPDHELPEAVRDRMVEASADLAQTGDPVGRLFHLLVVAGGTLSPDALADAPLAPSRPLADLAVELTLLAATRPDVVAEVRIDADWVRVRRGPADLDDDFRLDALAPDHFHYLRGRDTSA